MSPRPSLARRILSLTLALTLAGCATTTPYVGQGPHPQFSRGRVCLPIDAIGNVFGVFTKVFLLNWRLMSHSVSASNEALLVEFAEAHKDIVGETQIRLNEYAPQKDFVRLFRNHKVALFYRIFPGLLSVIDETIIPGRLFAFSDYYNPWTDTVHVFSDHPAVGLHEIGHSYDINRRKHKGSYAFAGYLPLVDLYQEWQASDAALDYLIETGNRRDEMRAYKVLYPAYGTYVGRYLPFFGWFIGLGVGHIVGRVKAHGRMKYYRELDAATTGDATEPVPATPTAAPVPVTP